MIVTKFMAQLIVQTREEKQKKKTRTQEVRMTIENWMMVDTKWRAILCVYNNSMLVGWLLS